MATEVASAADGDRARQTARTQYAIVGVAARFPGGSHSPSAFWKLLNRGDPCIGSLSESRLSWPRFIDQHGAHAGIDRAYLLDNVAAQDMAFFGISAKEAELMDPQQRILMELSWETFESAGHLPSTYDGSSTGVFIGVCHSDYRELMAAQAQTAEAYVGTGNIPCMLANRISYYYNFKGPSITVDTACSSSLFAVAQAVSAIERGECQQALVGAVNLILSPTSSVAYYQAGMLSSSTTCNPFDDESDGYIRAEGAGMILVKTLDQARHDHDHVLAVIKGVAVNHGGKARSLTAPNALSQAQVITAAFEQAGVPVCSVNYIEAHGTGTPLGDPIEMLGMTRSFARLAKQQNINLPPGYCAVGAVKGCIGHSEAAAGMASIIKVLLAMQHRYLPPNGRLRNINRRIEIDDSPFYFPQEGREWSAVTGEDGKPLPLRAGISCFGFGGTNSHLLLESADMLPVGTLSPMLHRPMLFGLSAKNDARLIAYARDCDEWLSDKQPDAIGLEQLSRTLLMGREAMPRRLAIVADSVGQLVAGLRAFVEGRPGAAGYIGPAESTARWTDEQLQSMLGERNLVGLAAAWTQGQMPNWSRLFDRHVKSLPFVPTYPFDRKPFWVPWRSHTDADNSARRAPIHSLLHENISNFRRQAYRSVFTPQHAVVSGHRVVGHRMLPATAFLVMAHYAIADALALEKDSVNSGLIELTDVRWLQPLVVDQHPEPLELHLRTAGGAEGFQFEFLRPKHARICVGSARLRANTASPCVNLDACRNVVGTARLSGDECYEYYARIGLNYQDDYRVIEHIEVGDGFLIAQIAISDDMEDPLPAQLLDGALQSSIGTVLARGTSPPSSEWVMPTEAASIQVFAPCKARMWSVIRLDPDQGDQPLCQFDVDLCNEQGMVCVRIAGVRLARLAAGHLERSLATPDSDDAAVPRAALAPATPADPNADPTTAFEAVRRDLKQLLARLLRVSEQDLGDGQSFSECGVDSLLVVSLIRQINSRWQCKLTPTVIYEFPRVDLLAHHIVGLGLQTIPEADRSAPVVTSGDGHRGAIPPDEAASAVPAPQRFLADPSMARARSAHRAIVLNQPSQVEELSIAAVNPGSLGEQEVLIGVRAFSLNFGDLLCIRGLYPSMPAYPFTPGFEASGVIVQVGPAVTRFRVRDEVVALTGQALGAHASVLVCHSERVFSKPPNLRFEEACALPVVCLTVLDAFAKAKPRQGERILIQSAAGGLGLAAVQLAQHYGLEIFATAGSEQRLHYLKALGIRHLINYRESDFEREVRRITAGQGVDIVLNTLPGDAIQKGLNLLSPGGRYVEMAMTALKSANQIDLSVLSDNQALFSVDLRKLSLQRPQRLRKYLQRMLELHALGVFQPVIGKEFPFDRYREACQWLACRNSVGKVIVSIPTSLQMEPDRNSTTTTTTAAVLAPAAVAAEGIAIIGMSGRFAESDDVEQLWQHLACGRDLVRPVTRWDLSSHYASRTRSYCNHGSFLREIDTFDALFFGISGVEARHMDPQQRIFLEETWRALEDAGCAVDRLRGKACGVFVGCTEGDYHYLFDEEVPAQSFWGNALSVVPARVAYHFDLRGPAVAVDTACSSSLVALHQACQSLWLGEVGVAIAGGVYIQSTAKLYLSSERADMLSHRGRCHSFGALADGFVPGEGVGAIVLKRLSKALEDRDHIYGVIRGSGVGQDGATNGITAPSPASQCSLQSGIYRKFGINPAHIQMLEAHGTGTSLGDPIEFQALTRSFGEFTTNRQFCALGSIKSNIGHLAPAAGIAGVIKVLLSMQHRQIPPTLHSLPSNPQLQFENSPFYLSDSLRTWPCDSRGKRTAAISSFGFSGTNAHVVIEDYETASPPSSPRPAYLVALSAKSLQQLKSMANNLADTVAAQATDCGHLSFTLLTGRTHLGHRLATVVPDAAVLVDRLRGWVGRGEHEQVIAGECDPNASGTGVDAGNVIPDASRYAEHLVALARSFVRGGHPAFESLFSSGYFHKLSLPTYPFARTRCWVQAKVPQARPASGPGRANLHPLVHRNISTIQRHQYASYFSGTEPFFVDHRVRKKPVFPGVAYLEMATVAAAFALQADPQLIQLDDVYWLRPLVGDEPVALNIEVVQRDGALCFEVRNASDDEQAPYCKGTARVLGPTAKESADLEFASKLAEGGWQRFDAACCYDEYARRGIDYGDSHRLLKEVFVNREGNQLLARVAMSGGASREMAFTLDPGLLDAALQTVIGFELAADKSASSAHELLLPYALKDLVRYRPLPRELLVRASRRASDGTRLFDLDIHDQQGLLCLQLQGLEVRASTRSKPVTAATSPVVHDPEVSLLSCWKKIHLESAPDPARFGRQKTVSIGLDDVSDEQLRRLCPTRHKLKLTLEDTLEEISARLAECRGIEHLVLGLLEADPAALPGDEMIRRQYRAVLFLLRLIKALTSQGYDTRQLTCTILTRQAQALSKHDPIDPSLASIHGMVGSLAKECPEWRIRLLDVDRLDGLIAALPGVPFDSMGNALLYRGGHWYRQELQNCQLDEAAPSGFREGGAYVIVGGAGGLGEFFSEYLIQRYGARIVWIGRSELDDRIERKLDRLARLGNRPLYLAADAASQTEMTQALAKVKHALRVVHGVIHSALVLKDKTLASMQEAELTDALAAKVDASVRIAQTFAAEALDFILFFSSANSFFKAPGQGNYVAGCMFEDALALRMSQIVSCRVKVINWGYWGTTGAVANEAVARRMRAYGIGSIVPDQAVQILERLIAGPVDQLVYLSTTQHLTTLGVPVSGQASVTLEDVNGIVQRAFAALPEIADDGSRERIEPCLLPLLWAQIKRSGLVVLQHSTPGTSRRYRAIASHFERWLAESQRLLAANNLIELRDGLICIDAARDAADADWPSWDRLLMQYVRDTQSACWSVLVDKALRALPDILQGRQLATEVLFPDASMALVEGVYRDDPIAHFFNEAVAGLVAQYLVDPARASKQAAVRILEIGAGTGSTSERIFARLKANGLEVAEYCYTDVSNAFLLHAQERYASEYRNLTYDIVNIECAADIGATHIGKYDLVIAVKVLHATKDIEQTLQNAKSLLKPGGLLVINEISQNTLMMHLTFGLLDGWWLYQDHPMRMPGGPGIESATWKRVLLHLGFPHVYMPLAHFHKLGYQIIVAQSDGAIARQTIGVSVPATDTTQELIKGAFPAADSGVPGLSPDQSIETPGSLSLDKAAASQQLLEQLRTLVASVLEIDRGELDSASRPFGEAVLGNLGLDSLLSTNLRTRLLKDPGVDIAVQTLVGERVSAIVAEMHQQFLLQQISQSRSQVVNSEFETYVF